MIARLRTSRELPLALLILALTAVFTALAPEFLTLNHLFGIGRSSVVIGLLALGLLLVLITGGIDVSVSATAVASMYITTVMLIEIGYEGPFVIGALLACLVGGLFGLVNAILVTTLRLPSLIVTLGTLTLFRGGLLAFVGTDRIRVLPAQMTEFARSQLFTASLQGRPANFHVSVLVLLLVAVGLAWALRATNWGRSMYAVGDDEETAARLGVKVTRVRVSAFVLAGVLAGMAGMMSGALNRAADPYTIVGMELEALVAVVLGGAAVTGGRGTVLGTMLGVLLISMVGSSLVLIGIPTAWREAVIGSFLLLGVGVPALRRRRAQRSSGMVVTG